MHHEFTRYEVARILGARALQIAMDAPMLLKISEEELKAIKYDALAIAEKEFKANVLPISVTRPMPDKKAEKLKEHKEKKIDDADIIAKEKEVEEEIAENAEELGFAPDDEPESAGEDQGEEEQ